MIDRVEISNHIKKKAESLGFISCGISKSEFLENEASRLEHWLNQKMHGKMHYMENHFDKRLNPGLLVDGAKSVISVLDNYFPEKDLFENKTLKISKYAYGQDYHRVLKDKLFLLVDFIKTHFKDVNYRCFTDSAPVLEKSWAAKSGLGWIGKNGNLISPKIGSFYFIGEIIIDEELTYDYAINDFCGTCTKCIDACPTHAIVEPYVVDGSKCISYLTIELKDEIIPNQFKNKMDNWVFGCDVCQDVCPWNRFAKPTQEDRYKSNSPEIFENLKSITESFFEKNFKNSAISRTGFKGLIRNIEFAENKNEA